MKQLLVIALFSLICGNIKAQENVTPNDSLIFNGKYINEEYNIYLVINFNDKDVLVPGQEILGELDGYFGSTQSSHIWAITSSEIEDKTAKIDVINNYGSEDFTASLTYKDNETIEYKHLNGSTFKFPVNKKWQKIPSRLLLKKE